MTDIKPKDEFTADIGDGMKLSCLCEKHEKDSTCEVHLRNSMKEQRPWWMDEFEKLYFPVVLSSDKLVDFIKSVESRTERRVVERMRDEVREMVMEKYDKPMRTTGTSWWEKNEKAKIVMDVLDLPSLRISNDNLSTPIS